MQLKDLKHRSWKNLSNWEIAYLKQKGIMNGCGGAGSGVKNRLIRWVIRYSLKKLRLLFIESSCDIHDFTYWQGGDEERRKECDKGFYISIIADIGKADLGFLGVLKYTILALSFYYAVRIGGKDYFSYVDL